MDPAPNPQIEPPIPPTPQPAPQPVPPSTPQLTQEQATISNLVSTIKFVGESNAPKGPPTPAVQAPPAPLPPIAPGNPQLKQIRTYEGDMAEAIKKQNESVVSIQRAEFNKQEAVRTLAPNVAQAEEESHGGGTKALVMSLLTIVLLGGGGYGAYYAYNTYKAKTAEPATSTPLNQFISATSISEIDTSTISRETLLNSVHAIRNRERLADDITQIQLTRSVGADTTLLATADLLTRLSAHAPPALVRAFNQLFMLAVLGNTPSHPFIIVKLASFENAFPGMLEWEPRIIEDIWPIFANESLLDSIPSHAEFSDITIQNRDARIIKDASDHTALLYGFYDNSMLIITDNEDTFRTIVSRLDSQKLSR